MTVICGEDFQLLCDKFVGDARNATQNPHIRRSDRSITIQLERLGSDNPSLIFCFPDTALATLSLMAASFQNDFTLVTHNSDYNLKENDPVVQILLHNPRLKHWFGQNLGFQDPTKKLHCLPIGIANRMWPHGRCFHDFWQAKNLGLLAKNEKTELLFVQFTVATNPAIREPCEKILRNKGYPLLPQVDSFGHFARLNKFKFAICPQGNGDDCHRTWECLYLRVIPIVLRTPFMETLLSQMSFPVIVLDKWEDLELDEAGKNRLERQYEDLAPDFESSLETILNLEWWKERIHSS